jgi:hypothetical protein
MESSDVSDGVHVVTGVVTTSRSLASDRQDDGAAAAACERTP